MSAKALRLEPEHHMTSINMSRAFDTIDRRRLLTVRGNIVSPDEMRMHWLLFPDTGMVVLVGLATTKPFSNTTGTPCSLYRLPGSRIEGHQTLAPNPPQADVHIRHDTEYWDDVNSYSTRREWLQKPLPIVAETFQVWSLMVYTLKTVLFTVSTTDED